MFRKSCRTRPACEMLRAYLMETLFGHPSWSPERISAGSASFADYFSCYPYSRLLPLRVVNDPVTVLVVVIFLPVLICASNLEALRVEWNVVEAHGTTPETIANSSEVAGAVCAASICNALSSSCGFLISYSFPRRTVGGCLL
jgi:hypothetical protein